MRALLVHPKCGQTFFSMDSVLRMAGKKAVECPLALLTVAALFPQEWEFKLVERRWEQITDQLWQWSDLLLVSGMQVQASDILTTISEGKKRGKRVVVGGACVYHFPHEALAAGADIVVKGEAELVMPQLLEALDRGEKGLIIEAKERPDLRLSPIPRYDLLNMNHYLVMGVQFARGCPYLCEFCDVTLMYGRTMRNKPVRQVLQELQFLYDLGWNKLVNFADDNFIGNLLRTKELLRELIPWMEERGHPFLFGCQASVNLGSDDELLDLMVRAGFCKVFLGIETLDEPSLKLAKKYQNTARDLPLVCDKVTRAGLEIVAGCMIGFDGEKSGADQRLLNFAVANDIPEVLLTMLQAVPGTALWDRLEKEGRLVGGYNDEDFGSQTALMNFVPIRPLEEVVDEFVRSYEVLYDPANYLDRTFKHFLKMNPSPVKKKIQRPPWGDLLRGLLVMLYKHGVVYQTRWKFWRYLVAAILKFPGKLPQYLGTCVLLEHYQEYRWTVRRKLYDKMVDRDPEADVAEGGRH